MAEHTQVKPSAAVHDDVYSTVEQGYDLNKHRYGTSGFLIQVTKMKYTYIQILVSNTYSRMFWTCNLHKPPSMLGFL
jgi:hypothetical protein